MGNMINLRKSVAIVLEKRKLPQVTCAVAATFDISGSMQQLYGSGAVQEIAEKLFAIALKFDDNGNLDAWAFHNDTFELEGITEKNYATFVTEQILHNRQVRLWGGTSYCPALESIDNFYYGTKDSDTTVMPSGFFSKVGKLFGNSSPVQTHAVPDADRETSTPVFLMFLTDGENDDATASMRYLKELQKKNIYVEFVGIGNAPFNFCRTAADALPNVGFVQIKDITQISDDDLYEQLLNPEFCSWVTQFGVKVS